MARTLDTSLRCWPGQQIILKGLDQITTGTAPVDGIMKQMAADLTKEVQAIVQQVKAVEG